jgi:spore coat protein U-like protein
MKQSLAVITLGLMGLITAPAQAATATGTFNVSVSLTSVCQISTVPTAAFTYTSFQEQPSTFSSSFNIRCTNSLPITGISLDSSTVTDSATNLAYTLALGTVPSTGTGADQSVAITGSMAAGQAGTCATASCSNTNSTNKQRTLTITY